MTIANSEIVLLIKKDNNQDEHVFHPGKNSVLMVDKKIFDLLLIKNQDFDNIDLKINNQSVLPLDDNAQSLFMLAVQSQNIVFSACFLVDSQKKKARIEQIQNHLLTVKDLPLDNYKDKKTKIQKIFAILKEEEVAYILIDENDDTNKLSKYIIDPEINKEKTLIIITLEENTQKDGVLPLVSVKSHEEVTLIDFTPLDVDDMSQKEDRIPVKIYFATYWKLYTKNIGVFILQTLIIAFSLFLFGFIIHSFNAANAFLDVVFLIATVIVPFFVIVSVFDFFDKAENNDLRKRYLATLWLSETSTLLGTIVGFAILLIFASNNMLITIAEMRPFDFIAPAIVSGLFFAIPFAAQPIRKVMKIIRNKFIKK
ncbi:MAG: hypothetical protein PHQ38_02660 [Bacilli bacterium]|nr:hypothetical protein [Bacilli bacterium]